MLHPPSSLQTTSGVTSNQSHSAEQGMGPVTATREAEAGEACEPNGVKDQFGQHN